MYKTRVCPHRLHVGSEVDRHIYKYRDHPEEFNHLEGYYRMMMMVTVLQQDLGIHYNPERISLPGQAFESNEKFFADSKDVFIHGLTRDKGAGTCSSMPVFLAAIGRRLGYPLKLVSAKGHLFVRWEQGERSFNIEATSIGFVSHPDAYYRTWPAPFTPEEETSEGYLKAMTPMQELAVFLSIRGECLRASGDYKKALGAFAQAAQKDSRSPGYQKLFARAEREAAMAGVLPKRQVLLIELRNLEIPNGPNFAAWVREKARLEAQLRAGGSEDQAEAEMAALKAEMSSGLH